MRVLLYTYVSKTYAALRDLTKGPRQPVSVSPSAPVTRCIKRDVRSGRHHFQFLTVKMFYTKKDLEAAVQGAGADLGSALIVSQDLSNKDGSFSGKKCFYFCKDTRDYLSKLSPDKGEHMHEVLADKFSTRCWVYMDIDEACDGDDEAKEAKTVDYVYKVAKAFCLTLSAVGRNMQVLTSHAPKKLSIHVVIYIESFPAEVAVHMERVDKSVPWDPSVYSMFRSYRAPYHRKGGKEFRLVPWRSSSSDIKDHLIRILPDDHRIPIRKLQSVSIPLPKQKTLKTQMKNHTKSLDEDPCRNEIIKVVAETNLLDVIKVQTLDIAVGSAKRKGGAMYAYVERGFTCPFKGDSHKSNRGFVILENESISFRCLSPACRGKKIELCKTSSAKPSSE